MSRITRPCLALLAALFALGAAAQENPPVYDRIDLNVSAEREVENDIMVAIVFAEVEANTQSRAADEVNQAIRFAADRARATAGIEQQTLRYSTRPVYANDRRIVGWVARQSLRLESMDAAVLSTLLGELQTRVAIESMGSKLSKTARDTVEAEVISEAIAQFQGRAGQIAADFDRDGYRLVHLNVGSYAAFAQEAPMRALSAVGVADAVVTPTIEAGLQTVSVQVSGTIELDAEP